MQVSDFYTKLEIIMHEQVRNNFPNNWDEDFITRSILKDFIAKLGVVQIDWFRSVIKVEWSAYKFTGKTERMFGDVGLLVNIRYQDGDMIEGVAFLEAKKRTRGKIEFGALKFNQLKKIYKNAPSSMALLYDYEDITQFAENTLIFYNRWIDWHVWTPYTYSVVVPTDVILSMKKKDTSLYKFSLPFSHQLCFRYFKGFDLEFRKKAMDIAKGYAYKIGAPKYLLVISVAYGRAEPSRDIVFNRQIFRVLE